MRCATIGACPARRLLPRAPRRRGDPRGRHPGPGGRRRPPRRAGVRDPGRPRRGGRRRARRPTRRWPTGARSKRARPPTCSAWRGWSSSPTATRAWPGSPPTTDPARSPAPTSTRPRACWRRSSARSRPRSLTVYDDHGGYGHPDHIQVHHVGVRAAELARHATRLRGDGQSRVLPRPGGPDAGERARRASTPPTPRRWTSACPRRRSRRAVDVSPALDRKRGAMAAHPSQIPGDSFFLSIDDEAFRRAFGFEWFIRLDDGDAEAESGLL